MTIGEIVLALIDEATERLQAITPGWGAEGVYDFSVFEFDDELWPDLGDGFRP